MALKVTAKNKTVIVTRPGRWSLAIGLERTNRMFSREDLAWIDNHNIYQKLTTVRLCWLVAFTLSSSTMTKADVLAVGRWKRSQSTQSRR
jgi:hypothetical protein